MFKFVLSIDIFCSNALELILYERKLRNCHVVFAGVHRAFSKDSHDFQTDKKSSTSKIEEIRNDTIFPLLSFNFYEYQ